MRTPVAGRTRPSKRRPGRHSLAAAVAVLACAIAAAAAVPSSGAVSVGHSGWYWGNPLPQGNGLRALELFGNRGYAAGAFGTILRTDDAGATWSGLPSGTTADLEDIRVLDEDTLIAGGGCSLRRSDDGGLTFKRLPFTASDLRCSSRVASFDFADPAVGFLLLDDGTVVQTPDGGDSFAQRTAVPRTPATGSGDATPTDVAFTSATTGFAVTAGSGGGRIYRTTDGAGSWTEVASGPLGLNGIRFPSPTVGYAVGAGNTVLKTADGGAAWSAKPLAGAPADNDLTDVNCAGTETCLISTAAGDRLLRTTDGGDTGASVTPSTRKVFAADFASDTRAVAVGAGGTTVVSDTAGATFDPIGGRLPGAFGRLRATSASTAYSAGRDGRIARTTDGGRSWSTIGVSTAADLVDVSFPSTQVGFALDSSGTALRTDNGGATFRILNTGSAGRANALLAPDPRRVLLIGPRGIRRSTNGGEQFAVIRSAAVRRRPLFDVDRAGRAIFAYGARTLAVSVNGGARWKRLPLPRGAVREIDFTSGRVGFLLQRNGRLYSTRNRGRRWTEIMSVGSSTASNIAFGDARHGFIDGLVTGPAGGGALHTSDGGRSWQPQLITQGLLADLDAFGPRAGFALADGGDSPLFGTDSGGEAGRRSRLSLESSARTVRRGKRVRVSGRLRPASGGEFVVVSMRSGNRWARRPVRVASNGAFSSMWRIRRPSYFVAQWSGDDARRGDGTAALDVRIGTQRRRGDRPRRRAGGRRG